MKHRNTQLAEELGRARAQLQQINQEWPRVLQGLFHDNVSPERRRWLLV